MLAARATSIVSRASARCARRAAPLSTYRGFEVHCDDDDVAIFSQAVGPFGMNQHLIACKQAGEAAIIDSGEAPGGFMDLADRLGFQIWHLVQTHAHIDHVAGLGATKEKLPAAMVYLAAAEMPVYESVELQARSFGVDLVPTKSADAPLLPNVDRGVEIVRVGDLTLEGFSCPGHSPGHTAFAVHLGSGEESGPVRHVFGGDLIFQGSVGRTDLPLCDPARMEASVRDFFLWDRIGPDTVILPGHMGPTRAGDEVQSNPFVRAWASGYSAEDLETFRAKFGV